jgi:hypothetical protein
MCAHHGMLASTIKISNTKKTPTQPRTSILFGLILQGPTVCQTIPPTHHHTISTPPRRTQEVVLSIMTDQKRAYRR